MSDFLSPGVKTREVTGGAQPLAGVSASTGCVYGVAERGPVGVATLVTSLAEFQRVFGDALATSFLFFSVRAFFENGGSRLFVTRVTHFTVGVDDSAASTFAVQDVSPATTFNVNAISNGTWGDRIKFQIDDASSAVTEQFKLTVLFDDVVKEVFDNIIHDPTDTDRYIINVINGNSDFIVVAEEGTPLTTRPVNITATALASGDDGLTGLVVVDFTGDATVKNGILSFDDVDEVLNIEGPINPAFTDADNSTIADNAIAYAAGREDSVAVVAVPEALDVTAAVVWALGTGTPSLGASAGSQFGNVYYPHALVSDPIGVGSNPVKFVPPTGHVLGIYARTDRNRGPAKAPAGLEANLLGVLGVERKITKVDHDLLNPVGVNAIRVFPGRGTIIFGARNLDSRTKFRYTNVRRYLNFYRKTLEDGLFGSVFEPNDPTLWGQLRRVIRAFNNEQFIARALTGNSSEEAFFIKIDSEINTPITIARGELHAQIGIAISRPAEFIILDITQFAGSVLVEES